jgi:hypothetical protein
MISPEKKNGAYYPDGISMRLGSYGSYGSYSFYSWMYAARREHKRGL